MAKVKRSVLKKLIKECLVEILIEGINSEPGVEALVEAVRPRPSSDSQDRYKAEVDRIEKQRQELDRTRVNEHAINSIARSDDVMADILRDTASTTLVEQGMSNDARSAQPVAGDKAAKIVADNNLEDLFEGAGNWAALAFNKE